MIDATTAYNIVMGSVPSIGSEMVNLEDAIGRVLAESVVADRDFPPFDRVTMDGITINYEAYQNGQRTFPVEAVGAAGNPRLTLTDKAKCIEIMTGAILPKGCDTVIRYEDLIKTEDGYLVNVDIIKGKNVHRKGSDHEKGVQLLSIGHQLKSIDINILATVGKVKVLVNRKPTVAVISSGDELVEIGIIPQAHQIRRSNSYMLAAKLKELGITANSYHLPDSKEIIKSELESILETHDTLLLSGGVSKGKFDFIPDVLDELGFTKFFHKVAQRPGKPFWFGTKAEKTIFAFPGNPVSTLACFHRYCLPWISKVEGKTYRPIYVELDSDIIFKPNLTYFCQAALTYGLDGKLIATPSHGNGSGDIVHPTKMDGFVVLPSGKEIYKKGEVYQFLKF